METHAKMRPHDENKRGLFPKTEVVQPKKRQRVVICRLEIEYRRNNARSDDVFHQQERYKQAEGQLDRSGWPQAQMALTVEGV